MDVQAPVKAPRVPNPGCHHQGRTTSSGAGHSGDLHLAGTPGFRSCGWSLVAIGPRRHCSRVSVLLLYMYIYIYVYLHVKKTHTTHCLSCKGTSSSKP